MTKTKKRATKNRGGRPPIAPGGTHVTTICLRESDERVVRRIEAHTEIAGRSASIRWALDLADAYLARRGARP